MKNKESDPSSQTNFTFKEFPPGYVHSQTEPAREAVISYGRVKCQISARFGTLLINPSRFIHPSRPHFYDISNVNFAVGVYTQADVTLIDGDEIVVDPTVERPLIVRHAADLIRKATGSTGLGFKIDVHTKFKAKHAGLATGAAIQHSVAYAINKILGQPLSREQLITYLAENNGEESDREGFLVSEPSTGGLGAVSLWDGGVVFLGDEMKVVGQTRVPDNYVYVLGLPSSGEGNIERIEDNYRRTMAYYEKIDEEWGEVKRKMVEDELLPAFRRGDIRTIGRLVFDFTLNRYGDIQGSFDLICPGIPMSRYMRSLEALRLSDDVISAFVSSTGSNIVILTTKPEIAKSHLKSLGIENIMYLHPDNVGATFKCNAL